MVHQMQERNDLSSQMPMRMDFHEIIFEGFGPFRGEQLIILRRRGLTKITGVWENGFLAHLTALVNRWQRFQHSYGACLDIDSSLEKMIFDLFGIFLHFEHGIKALHARLKLIGLDICRFIIFE